MKNTKLKIKILSFLASMLFRFVGIGLKIKPINYPEVPQFIVALWHAHQCVLYNIRPHHLLNVLVSQSNDGQIVATATEAMKIKTIRGSHGRKGTEATFKLIEKLEQGENIAITVDGPKGPNRVVKKGIINIAKISQVPIVPVVWHSTSKMFLKFKSWDSFRFPFGWPFTVALYGEPIYVPQDCDDEKIEIYRKKLEETLRSMEKDLVDNYEEYKVQ